MKTLYMECLREFPHPDSHHKRFFFHCHSLASSGRQRREKGFETGFEFHTPNQHQTQASTSDRQLSCLSPPADRYVVELIASRSGTDPCRMWTTEILPRCEADGPRGRTTRRTGRDTVRLQVLAHRTGFGVKRSGTDTAGFVLCLNGHLRERLRF